MKILKIYPTNINDRYLDEAVQTLRDGGIIIYPTDTLYALGCDALNNGAIERLCRAKGIDPRKQSLAVVCDGLSMASEYARIDNEAYRILKRNLPGPFTFILPTSPKLPKVFKGRREVGIRIPDNTIARALAERLGHPLISSTLPLAEEETTPEETAVAWQGVASLMIDGGEAAGHESAVVSLADSREPEVIREGPVPLE